MNLKKELEKIVKGEVLNDDDTLEYYSTDASLFKVRPQVVVYPKDADDVKNLVCFVSENKAQEKDLSITARSAGSDMSGGPLNESIILDFTKYFNHFELDGASALVEPGVFYRDFESETLKKGYILPSYPASKSIAALGGMISNNSGGEKTLRYGKTEKYVRELKIILSDGNEYTFCKLNRQELEQKKSQQDFEGEIYSKLYKLLEYNYEVIQKARPRVSKNSAGYSLWNVWDREYFDLTQLFVGSQGTLGIITEATLELVKTKKYKKMTILFLDNLEQLPKLVNVILPLEPEGLETFDDNTLKLAIRFFPAIAKKSKAENLFKFALKFLPDALIQLRMLKLAKLVVLVQFAEDSDSEAENKLTQLDEILKSFKVRHRTLHTEKETQKYWTIRRESFSLLREHVQGKRTAPFIDDLIVKPEKLPELLPKVYKILKDYNIKMTLTGHAGSGNFHIIPLMDLTKASEREKIPKVSDKVYDLVIKLGGSITAEHNDGLIRSPYLEKMYGKEVYNLFEEVKRIFDPQNIFNPGKKVNSSLDYAMKHINTE